jgi:hypothetical protein
MNPESQTLVPESNSNVDVGSEDCGGIGGNCAGVHYARTVRVVDSGGGEASAYTPSTTRDDGMRMGVHYEQTVSGEDGRLHKEVHYRPTVSGDDGRVHTGVHYALTVTGEGGGHDGQVAITARNRLVEMKKEAKGQAAQVE